MTDRPAIDNPAIDRPVIDRPAIDCLAPTALSDVPTITSPPVGIEQVLVVIPARNEEQLIASCLASVIASSAVALVPVTVVVALDGCTDGTRSEVDRFPGVLVHDVDLAVVGLVRAAGVCAGLDILRARTPQLPFDPATVWVAHTDADTTVPSHWLAVQLELAAAGHDLVVGSAEPDPADLDATILTSWLARHHLGEGHGAVHGANLGVRGSTLGAVGGFRALTTGEDVDLVHRVRQGGHRWISTDRNRVRTSGRRIGRLTGGFADFLTGLDDEVVAGSALMSAADARAPVGDLAEPCHART